MNTPSQVPLKKVKVIGVVGGIASGKSHVTRVLRSLGCERIDADAIGHHVLRQPLIIRRLVQRLGASILGDKGEIDRRRLADLVFTLDGQRTPALAELEEITHPPIHAAAVRKISELQESPSIRAIIVDAPLLLEAGWASMCDVIIFVETPATVRFGRAEARGWTKEHFDARELAQIPVDEKRRAATHVISGELPLERLREELEKILGEVGNDDLGS
ncbi:MAG TPA: dephospho-CoA kinase [Planctomycetaceae bacterium]|nr:dephospho-CoA kinase [Planctomycetaceae bacterium]